MMLLGWGLLGWSLVILSAVATAKLLALGETGWRHELSRILEPWRRARLERAALRRAAANRAMMCECERRYKGKALG